MKWRPLSIVDQEYDCIVNPAPILSDVVVQDLTGKVSPGWHTVIDSGSDLTIIPIRAAAYLSINIAARKVERKPVKKANSDLEDCPRIYLQISHPDFGLLEPVKAGIMNRSTVLLGRDCLKQVIFRIHGPKGKFIIHQNRNPCLLFAARFLPNEWRQKWRLPGSQP